MKLSNTDFEKAMNDWAKRWGVGKEACDDLAGFVIHYESLMAGVICDGAASGKLFETVRESILPAFSLAKPTSAEKMKEEVDVLRSALSRLSNATVINLGGVLSRSTGGLIPDFIVYRKKLIDACDAIKNTPLKSGPKEPIQRKRFVYFLALIFKEATGDDPTSSPDSCFTCLLDYALQWHGINRSSYSKDIQAALRLMRE